MSWSARPRPRFPLTRFTITRSVMTLWFSVAAFNTMNTLDYCAVWWVTQFGIECIARREASATDAQKTEFKSYKNFVTRNKKKAEAGFLHIKVTPFSTPNRAAAAAAAAEEEEEEEEEEKLI